MRRHTRDHEPGDAGRGNPIRRVALGVAAVVAALLVASVASLYGWSRHEEARFKHACLAIPPGTPSARMIATLDPKKEMIHMAGYSGRGRTHPEDVAVFRRYRLCRFQNCEAVLDGSGRVLKVEHTRGTDFDEWTTPAYPRRAPLARIIVPLLP